MLSFLPSADFAPVVVQVVECVPVGINVPGLDMLDCAPLGAMVLGALHHHQQSTAGGPCTCRTHAMSQCTSLFSGGLFSDFDKTECIE